MPTVGADIDLGSHYSDIIAPKDYNQIISKEHLYIGASDNFISIAIRERTYDLENAEVVELGCGPGRLLPIISKIQGINLTLIDVDVNFLEYARLLIKNSGLNANIVQSSVENYQHNKPVNIFYSQGMHHHIAKGHSTTCYLTNIFQQLSTNGYYIISDEFLPDYKNNDDRDIKAIIWYAHIIAHAVKHKFNYLAQEEAKTLLDDLFEGHPEITGYKSEKQISLIINAAKNINTAALKNNFTTAEQLSKQLFSSLKEQTSLRPSGENDMDLSRHDFKISDAVFQQEIANIGFKIEERRFFGLNEKIGGMVVYVLKKS